FFFQAEDGIRDRNVTGVQTCALPIYSNIQAPEKLQVSKLNLVAIAAWSSAFRRPWRTFPEPRKRGTPNIARCAPFEACCLKILWSLEFGIWSLEFQPFTLPALRCNSSTSA